jgi:hypothetical protein
LSSSVLDGSLSIKVVDNYNRPASSRPKRTVGLTNQPASASSGGPASLGLVPTNSFSYRQQALAGQFIPVGCEQLHGQVVITDDPNHQVLGTRLDVAANESQHLREVATHACLNLA